MTTSNVICSLDAPRLTQALEVLSMRLTANAARPQEIVVCGGSALILTGAVARITQDVDIVALASPDGILSPDPLPNDLKRAAAEAAEDLGLPDNWLNNGPSRGEGGLYQMGLPEGLRDRWTTRRYGFHLEVHFIGRVDQIHFKLYAAVDRGGYHIEDLQALKPTTDELVKAARWAMTHDVSKTFESILKDLLRRIHHDDAADRL